MSIVSKIGQSFRDSYTELTQKVTWPTRQELTGSAVVVMIASLIIALFVGVVDRSFQAILEAVYRVFGA